MYRRLHEIDEAALPLHHGSYKATSSLLTCTYDNVLRALYSILEMGDPFAITLGVLAVVQIAAATAEKLYNFGQTVHGAKKETPK